MTTLHSCLRTLNHKMHRYYREIVYREKFDFSTQQKVIVKSSPTSGKTEKFLFCSEGTGAPPSKTHLFY